MRTLDHADYMALAEIIGMLCEIESDHPDELYGEEAGDLAAQIADFRERWS